MAVTLYQFCKPLMPVSAVHAIEREPSGSVGTGDVSSHFGICAKLEADDHELLVDTAGHSRQNRLTERRPTARPRRSIRTAIQPSRLIVIERRAFVLGCLSCWLGKCFQDLEILAATDVEMSLDPDALVRTAAVIVGVGTLERDDRWLQRQVAWLRARQPALPIMMIVEADEISAAADVGMQVDLQGYIPSFNSIEIAAAAVRLVVAGGTYFPRPQDHEPGPEEVHSTHLHRTLDLTKVADLTSREWAVVSLLAGGVPNKDIAVRLGMSLSTVKAHVHHIIRKLNVRNRTEVALLALFLQPGATGATQSASASLVPIPQRPQRLIKATNGT